MRFFLKQVLNFGLIFLVVSVGILFSFQIIVGYHAKKFIVEQDIDTVYSGDSHIQKSVNDTLIPKSITIGESAESTYYSYYKLVHLLNHNDQIKTVYLGLSYHNISAYYDEFIWGKYSISISPKYYYILPFSEQVKLLIDNKKQLNSYLKSTLKLGYTFLKDTEKLPYKGKYYNRYKNTKARKKEMDKRLKQQYYDQWGNAQHLSRINISYLEKIKALCQFHDVALYILNTPMHNYYKTQIPKFFITRYDSITNHYDLNVIDQNLPEFYENSFIPDGDHLSKEGAVIYSNYLKNLQ